LQKAIDKVKFWQIFSLSVAFASSGTTKERLTAAFAAVRRWKRN